MVRTGRESRKVVRSVERFAAHIDAVCKSRLRRLPPDDDATNRELTCKTFVIHHLHLHASISCATSLVRNRARTFA